MVVFKGIDISRVVYALVHPFANSVCDDRDSQNSIDVMYDYSFK